MKTIEEENNEYVRRKFGFATADQVKDTFNVFKAGAEFAQRWIPVEEELPPIGVEVIVKERFNEHEIYVFDSIRDRLIKCQDNCITHWRKIELK